jgi:LUD domain
MNPELSAAADALTKNGFKVRQFAATEDVAGPFAELIRDAKSIGFGGSATLRELGLDEIAKQAGTTFFDHWVKGLDSAAEWEARQNQGRAELFVTSANGVGGGRLVLIDGVGNRLAASVFGPKRVLFVVGRNKIEPTVEAALHRAKHVAGPKRAAQLGVATPCVEDGRCHDCRSAKRICRATLIVDRPSFGMDVSVWLIDADLGL